MLEKGYLNQERAEVVTIYAKQQGYGMVFEETHQPPKPRSKYNKYDDIEEVRFWLDTHPIDRDCLGVKILVEFLIENAPEIYTNI